MQKLSSLECSAFVATLNDCLRCEEMTCETDVDAPFGDLFQEIETPMVFACDDQHCVWKHDQLFTQTFHCVKREKTVSGGTGKVIGMVKKRPRKEVTLRYKKHNL